MFNRTFYISLIWALLIAVLSFLPGDRLPDPGIHGLDLLVHFIFYSILSFLLLQSFVPQTKRPIFTISNVIITSILYGGLIEIVQGTVFVYRTAEWSDMIANSIGAIAGYGLFIYYKPLNNRMPWNTKKHRKKTSEKDPTSIS